MEHWKRKGFIRDFKKLNRSQQSEIIYLLREFEKIYENPELYHKRCPKKRTVIKKVE